MKLTQKQKRIKIAEACGWKHRCGCHFSNCGLKGVMMINPSEDRVFKIIPDYFNDRNSTPEIVKALKTSEQRSKYVNLLYKWVEAEDQPDIDFEWLNSPQERCAEAFGITLRLWKEGE